MSKADGGTSVNRTVGADYSAVGSDQRFSDGLLNDQALLTELFGGPRCRFRYPRQKCLSAGQAAATEFPGPTGAAVARLWQGSQKMWRTAVDLRILGSVAGCTT